jgi:hypothetical protein
VHLTYRVSRVCQCYCEATLTDRSGQLWKPAPEKFNRLMMIEYNIENKLSTKKLNIIAIKIIAFAQKHRKNPIIEETLWR